MPIHWLSDDEPSILDLELRVFAPGLGAPLVETCRGPGPLAVGRVHEDLTCDACRKIEKAGGSRLDLGEPLEAIKHLGRHHFEIRVGRPYAPLLANVSSSGQKVYLNSEEVLAGGVGVPVRAGDIIRAGRHRFWLRRVRERVAPERTACSGKVTCSPLARPLGLVERLNEPGARRGGSWYCADCAAKLSSFPNEAPPGFQWAEWLGGGAMGQVYRVEPQGALRRSRVCKVIHPALAMRRDFVERFRREVETMDLVGQHPGVVAVQGHDPGPDSFRYLILEHVRGGSLSDHIRDNGVMDPLDALALFHQLVDLLDRLESHGLVHRDIKPANILVAVDEEVERNLRWQGEVVPTRVPRLKLADFGVAKIKVEQESEVLALTRTGASIGPGPYAAPEQLLDASKADHRVDIYAAGATLYHMLAGKHPLDGVPKDQWLTAEGKTIVPLWEARPGLAEPYYFLVQGLMANKPEHRLASAAEIYERMERL